MSDDPQTGGTLYVQGTIKFSFQVRSVDCNVFTLTELRKLIESDPLGWFIDFYLGSATPDDDDEHPERYDLIEFSVRDAEAVRTDLAIETLEKYIVLDPDEVPEEDVRQPLPPDDQVFD